MYIHILFVCWVMQEQVSLQVYRIMHGRSIVGNAPADIHPARIINVSKLRFVSIVFPFSIFLFFYFSLVCPRIFFRISELVYFCKTRKRKTFHNNIYQVDSGGQRTRDVTQRFFPQRLMSERSTKMSCLGRSSVKVDKSCVCLSLFIWGREAR